MKIRWTFFRLVSVLPRVEALDGRRIARLSLFFEANDS